ncbi:MAG: glycosyltransferase involved in cell wall biosynthesis [Cryomorphaceae bacterium]|jgi:glycosyltransferase involved in cell wall biosynthesis
MKYDTLIVAPYYEDNAAQQFCSNLSANISDQDYVIFVDDGSVNLPFDIELLTSNNVNGCVIKLRRNVGHQGAIAIGMHYAVKKLRFNQLVTMDSDGQDQASHIKELVNRLNHGQTDVVAATRKTRDETKKFKIFYFLYQHFFRILVGRSMGFGNFMALNSAASQRISASHETRLHVAASVLNSKLRISYAALDRGKRYAGESKMNLLSLILHGLRSIMVFAESVLVRITVFCGISALIILISMTSMVVLKVSGLAIAGWFSTVGGILLLLLFQVAIMAILVLLLAGASPPKLWADTDNELLIAGIAHAKLA